MKLGSDVEMELFPITLPKQNICTETELYYRADKAVEYDETTGCITLQKGTTLSLDTYFNCFSYSKYLQYTHARILEVHAKVQGNVQLCIMKAESNNGKINRIEKLVRAVYNERLEDVSIQYDFSKETGNGILYVEVRTLSEQAVVQFEGYSSPIQEEKVNPTKLAAVICTYKREEYVKRNLQHLKDTILANGGDSPKLNERNSV